MTTVHLIDGTYELFRYFYAPRMGFTNAGGREVGAVRGVLGSLLTLVADGATHVGVATDHVIPSFRNDLFVGYKTGEGIDPVLEQQFVLLEDVLAAAGFVVWPMVELEADDALASAARVAAADPTVDEVLICTPDKDLGQCLVHPKIKQLDRRANVVRDGEGVREKFGVPPESIPDYLGLVGDTADGIPGIAGWGAKSAAVVLSRYGHLENIPLDTSWDVTVRSQDKLRATLSSHFDDAMAYRQLATLRYDAAVGEPAAWCWPAAPVEPTHRAIEELQAPNLVRRLTQLVAARPPQF